MQMSSIINLVIKQTISHTSNITFQSSPTFLRSTVISSQSYYYVFLLNEMLIQLNLAMW